MEPSFTIVAIDGGAASGKSTTARALAARHHYLHVDTGAQYRAVTAWLLERGVAPEGGAVEAALGTLETATSVRGQSSVLRLDGAEAAAERLRSTEVNDAVSAYAALPPVRSFLYDYQRLQADVARRHGFRGLVMEGRDIGSVIFPDADLKVFLEASAGVRSERRAAEGLADTVEARDAQDSSRTSAPLACPEGAVRIRTDEQPVEAVVELISGHLPPLPAHSS